MENEKKLGLFRVVTLGIGGMMGSGIFIMMGYGAAYTGRSTSLAFIVSLIMMTMAYAFNMIVGSMFKLRGGSYEQLIFLCPPIISGFYGVTYFISSTAMAAYSTALVGFLGQIFPVVNDYRVPLAILITSVFFLSSIKGIGFMSYLQSAMTVIMVIAIALFIIVGLPQVKPGYFTEPGFFYGGGSGFLSAVSIVAFACMGTTAAPVSVAWEVKKATRTVPIAIILITLSAAVIYSLMAVVATGILPIEQVMGQDLSIIAKEIFPHWVYVAFILGGAVFAIATSLLGAIVVMRYPIIAAAEDGWLPKIFGKTTKSGFPWVTTLVMYLFAIVPVIFNVSIDTLVSYVMIPQLLVVALANVMMFKLPKRYPEQWKKSIFHMPYPLFLIFIAISVLSSVVLIYFMYANLGNAGVPILVITLVLFIYAYIRMKVGAVDMAKVEENRNKIVESAVEE